MNTKLQQRVVLGFTGISRIFCTALLGTSIAVLLGRRGAGPFWVAVSLGAYFLGRGGFAPVWGAIADTTGERRELLLGTSTFATISLVIPLLVEKTWSLVLVRGIYGSFVAGFLPSILTIVSGKGTPEEKGRWLGFFNSSRMAGSAMGRTVSGFVLGFFAPQSVYILIFGISIAATIATFFIIDPTPTPNNQASLSELTKEVKKRVFPKKEERKYFHTHGLKWLYLGLGLRHMTIKGIGSVLPVFLTQQLGASEFIMGILLAVNPGSQIFFMQLAGFLTDKIGRKPLIIVGMLFSGLYAILISLALLPSTLIVRELVAGSSLILLASSFSIMHTGAITFISDVTPLDHESNLQGFRSLVVGIGSPLGSLVAGIAATLFNYRITFMMLSLLAFTATFLCQWKLVESYSLK